MKNKATLLFKTVGERLLDYGRHKTNSSYEHNQNRSGKRLSLVDRTNV